jgi:hypothetical protein
VVKGKVEEVELPEKADILISEPMGKLIIELYLRQNQTKTLLLRVSLPDLEFSFVCLQERYWLMKECWSPM